MAKFNKTADGLLFYDDFTEQSLMWSLSPSDANCVRFGEGGLTMLHNRRFVTFTIVEPEADEYSCIVELDHIPYNFDDIGGIIVISNNKEYAECQTFLATGPSEFGNSNIINVDVERIVSNYLNDTYIRWSADEDSLDDSWATDEEPKDETEEDTEETPSEYQDTFYRFIRFTKQKYKYLFWASVDGLTWFEVGNVKFEDSGVIGFFLYGTTDKDLIEHSHFHVKSFALFSSKYITIDGINRSYDFEIFDGDGNIILRTDNIMYQYMISRSNTSCLINTSTLPMPIKNGRLRVFPHNDYTTTINEYELGSATYGGDSFMLEYNIRFFIDSKELNPYEMFDLGYLYGGNRYVMMTVRNDEDFALSNLKLRLGKYSEYFGGEVFVNMALESADMLESELDYRKEIVIDSLQPNESKNIFIKLTDKPLQDFYLTAHEYRFKIIIE